MQHGVALVEPTGLTVDEVLNRAPRQRRLALLNLGWADLVYRPCLLGVDQSSLRLYVHGLFYRSQLERNRMLHRNGGMHLDGFGNRGKSRHIDLKLIEAEGQALHVQRSLGSGLQSITVLTGLTGDVDRGLHTEAARVDHLQTQLAHLALRSEQHRAQNQKSDQPFHRAASGGVLQIQASGMVFIVREKAGGEPRRMTTIEN